MKIRRARRDDMTDHVILRQELWPRHDMEGLLKESHSHYQYEEEYPIFLAFGEFGDMRGFIELSIRQDCPGCQTDKVGYIEGWYVKKEFQGQGIGRALVLAAEEWAKSKGITEMASDTNEDYPGSPEAHKALGYGETPKPLHYMKQLK